MVKHTLYIKTCLHCNKKYFGYTTQQNVYRYKGSGIHWKAHIKKHKSKVKTTVFNVYNDRFSAMYDGIYFSYYEDIVNSDDWFNLCYEDCKTIRGYRHTKKTKLKMSKMRKGKKFGPPSKEHRRNLSISMKKRDIVFTKEYRKKISIGVKNSNRTLTEKGRQAISKTHKNKFVSNETRNKISKGKKGVAYKKRYCGFCDKYIGLNNFSYHTNGRCLFN